MSHPPTSLLGSPLGTGLIDYFVLCESYSYTTFMIQVLSVSCSRAQWIFDPNLVLSVEIDGGMRLNVIENCIVLPNMRSVDFWTTEVWKPIGVYAGDEFLGELRLCEPQGYDGGIRTAVHVIVTIYVDVDFICFIGVECNLVRLSAVEDTLLPEDENSQYISIAPYENHPATVSDDHLPYALGIQIDDKTWLNVVEKFAELPATRSVDFSTTEVWKPIGVYEGDKFLGELRLCEPQGYDGGLRTAVHVVVTMHVTIDLFCSIGVECTLSGLPYAEDEFEFKGEINHCASVTLGEDEEVPSVLCIPYALGVEIDNGMMLNVVEKFAELPATRSVEFLTADVRRPIGVYVGDGDDASEDARLGELWLCEPLDHDHDGPSTAVNVVVTVNVDEVGRCFVCVGCTAVEQHEDRVDLAVAAANFCNSPRAVIVSESCSEFSTCDQNNVVTKTTEETVETGRVVVTVTECDCEIPATVFEDTGRDEKSQLSLILNDDATSTLANDQFTPHAIGISIGKGVMKNIVEKSTKLPTTGSVDILVADVPKSIGVYVGDSVYVRENVLLGELWCDGGRRRPQQRQRNVIKFVVTIHIEADGHCFVGLKSMAVVKEIGPRVSFISSGDMSVPDGHVLHAVAYEITGIHTMMNVVGKYAALPQYSEVNYHLDFLTAYIGKPIYMDADERRFVVMSKSGNGHCVLVISSFSDDGSIPHVPNNEFIDKTMNTVQSSVMDFLIIVNSVQLTYTVNNINTREDEIPDKPYESVHDDDGNDSSGFLLATIESAEVVADDCDVIIWDAEFGNQAKDVLSESSSCDPRENATMAVQDTAEETDHAVAIVSQRDDNAPVAVVEDNYSDDKQPTVTEPTLNTELQSENQCGTVNHDSDSTSQKRRAVSWSEPCKTDSTMSFISVIEDGNDGVKQAMELPATDITRPISWNRNQDETTTVAEVIDAVTTVVESIDDEMPKVVSQDSIEVDVMTRDHESCEEAIDSVNDTVITPKKKKSSFIKRFWSWLKVIFNKTRHEK